MRDVPHLELDAVRLTAASPLKRKKQGVVTLPPSGQCHHPTLRKGQAGSQDLYGGSFPGGELHEAGRLLYGGRDLTLAVFQSSSSQEARTVKTMQLCSRQKAGWLLLLLGTEETKAFVRLFAPESWSDQEKVFDLKV